MICHFYHDFSLVDAATISVIAKGFIETARSCRGITFVNHSIIALCYHGIAGALLRGIQAGITFRNTVLVVWAVVDCQWAISRKVAIKTKILHIRELRHLSPSIAVLWRDIS